MFSSSLRLGTLFFVPGGFLLAAAALLLHFAPLPQAVRPFFPFYPYLVLGAGLFLGWRFNRSRLIFALLVLALAERALALSPSGEAGRLAEAAVALLLPLNLVLLSTLTERGLFTVLGLGRLGLVLAQPLAVFWLERTRAAEVLDLLTRPLIDLPRLEGLPLSQPALASFVLSLLFLSVRFLRRQGALDGGFLWALATVLPPLALSLAEPMRTLYFATAGLILVAAVIEDSYAMAFRDELTGLPARRALNETLQKVGRRYTVAMVDIDHFKKFNDRHGHDVGDQVLRMVASRLAKVNGGGQAFRYGGEEFTVLFPGKGVKEALPHLEELRESVAGAGFTLRHRRRPARKPKGKQAGQKGSQKLSVTVSIGAAERQGERNRPALVIKSADQALYRAKKAGRNRVYG
jgi:diguanylate cyclase (GGDEF)-like protein